ncbi:hypothetical protein [uncultured Megasphaera sp.]|uniref:hypothetical protein n=1 Tax=uncultured Megasphaera sp. TaxID=165188 RepID=UPI0025E1DFCB|nr:hypothetical protein [uncultured Megasphaera sp.]
MMKMPKETFSAAEKEEIFSHQRDNGPFSAIATETACLNYLDRLNRVFRDPLAKAADRRAALKKGLSLEETLFNDIRRETPLSYFDIDFREETKNYIRLREIYLDAVNFTFKRHRFRFVLDLLRLYSDDPCQILPERDIFKEKWEHTLLYDYLLLDMGQKNTEDIGREAVSNGYHECDYTLEIEEVWKQPMKAVPRAYFRFVKAALPYSNGARAIVRWMADHKEELAPALWVVDTKEIEALRQKGDVKVNDKDVADVEATFVH